MGLEIRLTGPVTLDGGCGQRRHLSSAQAQVAMVRLTMERRAGTTRGQLADTLWPDGLPDTWASALRSVVSRVRAFVAAALPPGSAPLVAQAGRYMLCLPDDAVVDLERAEAAIVGAKDALAAGSYDDACRLASGAASCLRAPFLPDHDGEWVTGVRQRLADLLVTGLETASLAASALGDHGVALGFANEAIRWAPLRESAHRCRMAAHVTAGNRAEALRTYQQLRRSLAEELGVDPAPETEVAYLELLGTPSVPRLGAGARPVGVSEAAASASAERRALLAPGSAVPFVGREAELDLLDAAWSRAQRGPSHMVLVAGEPGIGKTRLVTEAAQRVAAAGGLVLCGRSDRDAAGPCQPFVEAIGGYLAATPDDALAGLTPATRAELAHLAPTADPSADPSAPRPDAAAAGAGVDGGRPGLVEALVEVLERATRERPVLVVLDDVHLADRDSLVLLRRAARQCAGAPLLIVATAADGVVRRSPFAAAVHDLERDGWLQRLPLPGLGEAQARALARHVLAGAPSDRRPRTHRLVAETAGNPFLLLELLKGQRDDERPGPLFRVVSPAVHEYAAARADALGDGGRDLLRAALVAGDVFELDLAADAAGLAPGDALDALDALLHAGLVVEVDAHGRAHRYRFRHELVRCALYDQLSEARRKRLHARLADAIERLRRGELGDYTPAVAHHRAIGAPPSGDRQAARWGLAAAARARTGRAPNEAVRLYVQALDHLPPDEHVLRAEALTNLGLAQHDAGAPDCDRTLLDGAIQARRHGRLDIAARAALGLADVVTTRPRLRGEAAALVDDLLARAVPDRGPADGAVDDLSLGRLLARQAELGGRVAVGPATTGAAVRALARELPQLTGPDRLDHRLALAADLLAVATAAGDTRSRIVAAHHQAMAAELAGELNVRDAALAALASATGDTHLVGDALLADHAVAVAVTQGRFTDAATTARLADALADDDEDVDGIGPTPGGLAARQMLVAAWLRGSTWPADDGPLAEPPQLAEEALAALTAGDRGRAHLAVRALATGAEPLAADDEWPHAVGLVALAAVELGDPTTAEAVRALLLPYGDLTCGVGYRSFVGPAAFHLGRLALVTGDWPEAERHLTSALRQLAARGARPWAALTQLALAAALDARGRSSDRRWVDALRADAGWAVAKLGLQPRGEGLLSTN